MRLEAEWYWHTDVKGFVSRVGVECSTVLDCVTFWQNEIGHYNNWILAGDYGITFKPANVVRVVDGAIWRNYTGPVLITREMIVTVKAVVETEDSDLLSEYAKNYSYTLKPYMRLEPQACRVSFRRNPAWKSIAPIAVNI